MGRRDPLTSQQQPIWHLPPISDHPVVKAMTIGSSNVITTFPQCFIFHNGPRNKLSPAIPYHNLHPQVFVKKEEIATAIQEELEHKMTQFGYTILNALVTDINPDAKVKHSMNEINANRR
jgi:hypothetical protein